MLATYGYHLIHAELPAQTQANSQATENPHHPVDLFSREQLQAVMPAAPAGARLVSEQYVPNVYCMDSCPALTRQYDLRGGIAASCRALVAIRAAYLHDGYVEGVRYDRTAGLPAGVRDCRMTAQKMRARAYDAEFLKDTGPTSRIQFTVQVEVAGDRFTIVTRYF